MLVYHYTSIETLEKILSATSKENPVVMLRATHSNFLNDGTENTLGCMILPKCIRQIEEDLNVAEKDRISFLFEDLRFIQYAVDHQKMFDDHAEVLHSNFVISFSKDADSLVMWSMYGNKGDGVALGFETDELEPVKDSQDDILMNYFKEECLYWSDEDIKKTQLDKSSKLYVSIKELYSSMADPIVQSSMRKLYESEGTGERVEMALKENLALNLISFCSIFHKLGMWQNEKEYRVSWGEFVKIKYRKSASGVYVPYIDAPYPLSALKEIVIGPKCGRNAYGMVRSLFHSKGLFQGIPLIKESHCPLQ